MRLAIPASNDGPKTKNGCPQNMPTLYPGTHRCFQNGPAVNGGPGGHWGGDMCNIDPATDPVTHHRHDRKCAFAVPASNDGPKTKNGCPQNMPTLYPGTHRCFQSGPIVDGGEEPCAISILRPTQPRITGMIENASMTSRP